MSVSFSVAKVMASRMPFQSNDELREVAVGAEVGPLALPLESACNGVVSHGLLFESHFGQLRIAVHQVTEDECHLYDIFPDDVFLFARIDQMCGVAVAAFVGLAVFLDPLHGAGEFLLVVDAQFDAAFDLRAVYRFIAHAEVLLKEIGVGHRACDTHRHRTDREIGFAPHLHDGDSGAAETQEFFAYVGGNRIIAHILYVAAIDAEGGQSLLVVPGQCRSQINGARTFRAVETPDGFGDERVHVDGFGAVAPAGGDRKDGAYIAVAEFVGAGRGFGDPADRGVGDDAFDGRAVRITEFFAVETRYALCHAHGHCFERFADSAAAAVDDRTDADFRV